MSVDVDVVLPWEFAKQAVKRKPSPPPPPPEPPLEPELSKPAVKTDRYKRWTLVEILSAELPEPTWIVPGLLPAGLTSLCGRPKLGKSFLALQLAIAVGSGGVFLGQRVLHAPVIYIAFEDYLRRLQDRIRRMMASADADVTFYLDFPPLNTPEGLWRLESDIDELRPGLVIVDTLARAVGGRIDWNDLGATTAILSPLQELTHKYDCGLATIDHHSKLLSGDTIDDIIGSTGKSAIYDTAWGMYKTDGRASLKIVGREIEPKELVLTFDGLTGCWQLVGEANEVALTEREAQVMALLEELGAVDTKTVAKELDIARQNAYELLTRMAGAGKIVMRTLPATKEGGKKYVFSLKTQHDEHDKHDKRSSCSSPSSCRGVQSTIPDFHML